MSLMGDFCDDDGEWVPIVDGNLSPCFSALLSAVVPLAWLAVVGTMFYIKLRKAVSKPKAMLHDEGCVSAFSVIVVILSVLLSLAPVGTLIYRAASSTQASPAPYDVLFVTGHFFSWLFSAYLTHRRRNCVLAVVSPLLDGPPRLCQISLSAVSQWPLAIFWLLSAVFGSYQFAVLQNMRQYEEEGMALQYYAFLAWFPLYFVILLVGVYTGYKEVEPEHVAEAALVDGNDPVESLDVGYHASYQGGGDSLEGKSATHEERAGIISKLLYSHLDSMIARGYRSPLTPKDVDHLMERDTVATNLPILQRLLEKHLCKQELQLARKREGRDRSHPIWSEKPSMKKALTAACWEMESWNIIFAITLRIMALGFEYVGPLCLNAIVIFVADESEALFAGQSFGYIMVLLMVLAVGAKSICLQWYFTLMFQSGMRVRTALIALVYTKAVSLTGAARDKMTPGKIQNIMSSDLSRFELLFWFAPNLIVGPVSVIVTMSLLVHFLGWQPALASFGSLIVLVPIQGLTAKLLGSITRRAIRETDKRVQLIAEILQGIRVIKFSAWERPFARVVNAVREGELGLIWKAALCNAFLMLTVMITPIVVAVCAFGVFVLVMDYPLTAAAAFTAITLMDGIRIQMFLLPRALQALVEANISISRVAELQLQDEVAPASRDGPAQLKGEVFLQRVEFRRSTTQVQPTMEVPEFKVQEGALAVVVGAVGSGKSFLLSCLLGEIYHSPLGEPLSDENIPVASPCAVSARTRLAYVPQTAWIINATVKDNILFGLPYDKPLYRETLKVCALLDDLKMLPGGDNTEIGERGINLSGGQKQRVSIARAVYRRNQVDIFIFDDPLSALDAHVGKHVFDECIMGVLKNKTKILVTHQLQYCRQADTVVLMECSHRQKEEEGAHNDLTEHADSKTQTLLPTKDRSDRSPGKGGKSKPADEDEEDDDEEEEEVKVAIKEQGNFDQLCFDKSSAFSALFTAYTDSLQEEKEEEVPSATALERQTSEKITRQSSSKDVSNAGQLVETEAREVGQVQWAYYKLYFKHCTYALSLCVLLTIAFSQVAGRISDVWLSRWTSDIEGERSATYYVEIYAWLSLGTCLITLISNVTGAWMGLVGGRALHKGMLASLLRAPVAFYDTTPLGRIINRFTKDTDSVDKALPGTFYQYMNMALTLLSVVIVICIVTEYFAIVLLPLSIVFYWLQQYYRRTSRELKRLDSVTRSPIFSHFAESLDGLASLRAYRDIPRAVLTNAHRIDHNLKLYYIMNMSNRWLGLRLDLIGGVMLLAIGVFLMLLRQNISEGLVALCLSYGLQLTMRLNWMVRQSIETEVSLNSVERAQEYSLVEPEGFLDLEGTKPLEVFKADAHHVTDPPADWPQGQIEFKNVSVRYRTETPLVLKNVTCTIKARERVGVVGRTGAGKSSLMVLLFRIVECAEGKVLIDGLNTAGMRLAALRSRLSIIPQDPVMFAGTVKYNLDPFGNYPDEQIWESLKRVRLETHVQKLPSQLEADVSPGGDNFSVGQRQLFCLARALLRNSRIIVLDEATASVDLETDALIQDMVRTQFAHCTVLTIAHRIDTIMDYDKIMVLDKGRLAEFDTPSNLLDDPRGLFTSLVQRQQEAH